MENIIKTEYKIIEIFNPNLESIDEKLNEVFITFLIEKLTNIKAIENCNNNGKPIEKFNETKYNSNNWIGETVVIERR